MTFEFSAKDEEKKLPANRQRSRSSVDNTTVFIEFAPAGFDKKTKQCTQ